MKKIIIIVLIIVMSLGVVNARQTNCREELAPSKLSYNVVKDYCTIEVGVK